MHSPGAPAPRGTEAPKAGADVVVIAASAGGLKVLKTILAGLPADFPVPIVIVQHRTTALPNLAAKVLGRAGPLPATMADEGEVLRPGTVYVAPPDRHLVLDAERRITLMDGRRIRFVLSSANPLFESAAGALNRGVIGVVLSGYGADGTDGVQAIKARGGVVIAQDPATAAHGGMPSSAIRTGAVDYVVPAEEIAPLLLRLVHGREPGDGGRAPRDPAPADRSQPGEEDAMKERILACTHAGDGALGALRFAAALAERDGYAADVLAVIPTVFTEGITLYALPDEMVLADRPSQDRYRERVREQLRQVGGPLATAEPHVEVGQVSVTISTFAREHRDGLILLGSGRHGAGARLSGTETSLYVTRMARVPVLAVPPGEGTLPRCAVAAVDFSGYSRDAARTAARLLGPGGTLHLVHTTWVAPGEMRVGGDWATDVRKEAATRLDGLADELREEAGVEPRWHLATGDPARSVLQLVLDTGAGLLAAGSHGHGFFTRMLLGSTSTRLLRDASCAVLVAPPRAASEELDLAEERHAVLAGVPAGPAQPTLTY
ncbi:MAG TPA: chemotaxis protein CheB [Longimicrobium sp.]